MAGRPKGTPKTGGRKKGVLNHATAEIKALAQLHGPTAIATLVSIMKSAKQPGPARVAAARELLDRGYGRPVQEVAAQPGSGFVIIAASPLDERI